MPITLKGLAGIVLIFCAIGLSAAQDDSFDEAKEEEILRNAGPEEDEIFNGFNERDCREEQLSSYKDFAGFSIYCTAQKPFQCPEKPNQNRDDYHEISVALFARGPENNQFTSPEAFYEEPEFYGDFYHTIDEEFEIYNELPVGVIQEKTEVYSYFTDVYCHIIFWKDIKYTGSVYIRIGLVDEDKHGCTPLYQDRVAEAEIYARSECGRLAKLMYDRLPGDEVAPTSKYEELRSVLVVYGREPLLWGDKENATKALDKYKGPKEETISYPTNKLLYYMLPEIVGIEKIADMPDIDCSEPLYKKDMKWIDTLSPLIPGISDLIPGSNLKTYCELVKNEERYAVEKFVYTKIIEKAYHTWVNAYSAENSIEAIKNMFASGRGFYAVKTSSELYKDMNEDEFYNLCLFNFRERYNCEKSQRDIQYVKEHKKDLINKVIMEYNPTLVRIEDTIETLQKSGE